jgi:hypothetical protein
MLDQSPSPVRKPPVSIVRVGLAETQKFADGYSAIFGKKPRPTAKKAKPAAKVKRKPARKK